MKNKIKNDRNFMLKVLSLLFALILWSYVRSDQNIIITRDFKNIDVVYEGQEQLRENNLTIISPKEFMVDVELKGYNTYMRTASRDGISAKVNLSDLGEGEHSVPVNVSYIDYGVTVSKISQKTIPFKIDRVISQDFDIDINLKGELPNGYLIGDIDSTKAVKVTGPSTLVNKIDSISANIDLDKVTETTSLNLEVTAYDSNKDVIKDLTIEPSTIKVDIPILKTKTVPIEPEYVKNDTTYVNTSDFTIEPSSVTIKGNPNLVDSLEKISTYPIDISNITEENNEVELKLPEKIKLVEDVDKVKVIKKSN